MILLRGFATEDDCVREERSQKHLAYSILDVGFPPMLTSEPNSSHRTPRGILTEPKAFVSMICSVFDARPSSVFP